MPAIPDYCYLADSPQDVHNKEAQHHHQVAHAHPHTPAAYSQMTPLIKLLQVASLFYKSLNDQTWSPCVQQAQITELLCVMQPKA